MTATAIRDSVVLKKQERGNGRSSFLSTAAGRSACFLGFRSFFGQFFQRVEEKIFP
jgi:hypothetical protein